jgi:periplasmic copper chaperone A
MLLSKIVPVTVGLVVLTAGPAAAHVTISPSEGAAGSFTVLTASVPHGCEGSPTTRIAIQLPDEIMAVTPTRNALWDVEKVMETLDEPVTDAHGNEFTERVDQVVYTTDDPLPEGQRDAFELSLQLPDTPGETLAFPIVQTCEEGETAWVETSDEGSTEELQAPAPTVAVLAAEGGDAEGAAADVDEASAETTAASGAGASDDGGADTLAVAALVAGLLGLAAGVGALVVVRRRP